MDFPGERKENFRIFIKTGSADGKMRYAKHKDMCYDESVFGCSGNVEHGETTYRYRRKGKRRIQNMKFVVQRVSESEVSVDGERIGKIGKGFLVLIGVGQEDTKETADKMVKKMIGLRIFEDENGKTNLSLADVGGELLLISQFTLYADCRRGNRPSFASAGAPKEAEALYEYIIGECKKSVEIVERGQFGADMKVSLVNDGPFTIVLNSKEL